LASELAGAPAPTEGARSFDFEPKERLGSGASSDVFRARHRVTGQAVALKIGRDHGANELLASEGERLALGMSPYLPELVDIGWVPASEAIAGGSVAPYLALSLFEGTPSPSIGRSTRTRGERSRSWSRATWARPSRICTRRASLTAT
jgi:hypothetical protein